MAYSCGYLVTSQIIAGFCPEYTTAAPAIKYLNDRIYIKPKESILGKIGDTLSSAFRSVSNMFSKSSRPGCFQSIMNQVEEAYDQLQEMTVREMASKVWDRVTRRHTSDAPIQPEETAPAAVNEEGEEDRVPTA